MDLYSFPPVAALLNAAYSALTGLAALLEPVAGAAAAALAIAVVTLAVRAAMIPLGVAQVRAEFTRRRLAPRLRELQKRHAKQPEVLQRKTLELYRDEGTSPFAGLWPAFVQLPVVSVLYAVFTHPTIGGHGNALLGAPLLGVPLGHSPLAVLGSATAWPDALVAAALLLALAVTAFFGRRQAIRFADAAADPAASPATLRLTRVMSSLSFLTVVFAAFAPLAAAIYLLVTTTWTLIERALLRRRLDPGRAVIALLAE